jgi:aldehyde:ferredoxin oxidoreductase
MSNVAQPAQADRPFGFTGRILHVNLSNGSIEIEHPGQDFYRTYLGGSALGMRYVYRDVPAGADPLGPDDILTSAVGPLAETPKY